MKYLSNLKIVHIGLGKTGTTTLQKNIFPDICDHYKINYLDSNIFKKKDLNKNTYHPLANVDKIDLPENFLLSNENLVGTDWRPQNFEKAFQLNKKIFDQECKILISIRKPSDLLNSTYLTSIHQFKLIKEKDFFVYEKDADISNKKFNLYYFDYEKLINLYKSYFKHVVVVKYEDIFKLDFLDNFFDIKKEFKEKLIEKIKKNHLNKSFSTTGVKIFFLLNKFFNLKKFHDLINKKIFDLKYKDNNLYNKIRKKFLAQLLIRQKIHQFDSIKFFYKKYKINEKNLPINIEKLNEKYFTYK